MDEVDRLRNELKRVRELAKGAQAWHEMVNPTQVLDIVGREDPPPRIKFVIIYGPARPIHHHDLFNGIY